MSPKLFRTSNLLYHYPFFFTSNFSFFFIIAFFSTCSRKDRPLLTPIQKGRLLCLSYSFRLLFYFIFTLFCIPSNFYFFVVLVSVFQEVPPFVNLYLKRLLCASSSSRLLFHFTSPSFSLLSLSWFQSVLGSTALCQLIFKKTMLCTSNSFRLLLYFILTLFNTFPNLFFFSLSWFQSVLGRTALC